METKGKTMKNIKADGKKRRAKLLVQLGRFDTITELAEFHHVTRARMSRLIVMARKEI